MRRCGAVLVATSLAATPAFARESLGVFDGWAAFRDAKPTRCYAIAEPEEQAGGVRAPFATISWWPANGVRGQIHFRLRFDKGEGRDVFLQVGSRRWRMTASKSDAWAHTARHDSFILARIRESGSMTIAGIGPKGGRFVDTYALAGAASAMDAAALGCAQPR